MGYDTDYATKDPFEKRSQHYLELFYQGRMEESYQGICSLLAEVPDDSYRLPLLLLQSFAAAHLGLSEASLQAMEAFQRTETAQTHPFYQQLKAVIQDGQSLPGKVVPDRDLAWMLLHSTRNQVYQTSISPANINFNHLEILCRLVEVTGCELLQVYFHAMLAWAALFVANEPLQRYHEDKAREIILRRRWYLLFAEYYYYLDWHLEQYITDQKELAFINGLIRQLFDNYLKGACRDAIIAQPELMTPEVLRLAVLRSLNRSNADIERCMDISPYWVRKYTDTLQSCLGRTDRKHLQKIVQRLMWFM